MKMNNFDKMMEMITKYHLNNGINKNIISCLHDTSKSDPGTLVTYVYNGSNDLNVIDMDTIAKYCYKKIKKPQDLKEDPINTVDAFLINHNNDWYFIEFKDSPIHGDSKSLKNNIIKKAYSSWYMLMDMLYEMKDKESGYHNFDFNNPIKFAQEHIYYILVCTLNKNPTVYKLIKENDLANSTYTPPFMCRLKGYLFKDAYVYTEEFMERKFVRGFIY